MRKLFFVFFVLLVGSIFLVRLFYLQIYNTSADQLSRNNAVKAIYEYPLRGDIYDRNNKLLVSSVPSYDIMVIPREVKAFDTLEFCNTIHLPKEKLIKILKRAKRYSSRLPSVVVRQLSRSEYAYLQEKLYKFQGFYIQKRSLRFYETHCASNVLGYTGEVSRATAKKDPYYNIGDQTGIQGVEKQYEEALRGEKGVRYLQKDRFNREIGSYKEGLYDSLPVKGKDVSITLDIDLQAYGEKLMQNKRGGIVAIEPSSGEVLALVTAPSYDPKILVGRQRSQNFTELFYDSISKPLMDRGLQAEYPPGSTFKMLNALIALQEDVVDPSEIFSCYNGYKYSRRRKMGCHDHKNKVNLDEAIALSCNSYFAQVYRRAIEKYPSAPIGLDNWQDHALSFGFGNYLGYDLPVGRSGKIPKSKYYDKIYPRGSWRAVTTLSNAIGQGEILATPIQLANFTAAIANRGFFYTPHFIKKIDNQPITIDKYTLPRKTSIDSLHFEEVIAGMQSVFDKGTAEFLQVKDIEICGKTGTSENFTKINGKRVQLTDHSIFIAFAPKHDPKIALAVFVENGYWGARYAGRISSLMIEKYLKGEVESVKHLERWVLSHSLEEEYQKPYSGKPFKINR